MVKFASCCCVHVSPVPVLLIATEPTAGGSAFIDVTATRTDPAGAVNETVVAIAAEAVTRAGVLASTARAIYPGHPSITTDSDRGTNGYLSPESKLRGDLDDHHGLPPTAETGRIRHKKDPATCVNRSGATADSPTIKESNVPNTAERTVVTETWRPVAGYQGFYEVSDLGHVRSLDRWIECSNRWGSTTRYFKPGRVLKVKRKKKATHAYAVVTLSVHDVQATFEVHRLVLQAFRGECPPGQQGCHEDGNLFDNRLSNLRWGTPSSNAQDRIQHGTNPKVNQTDCHYGHPLEPPNLEPSLGRLGYRRCFACSLTTNWGRNLGYHPGDEAWLFEAHRRHAEILHHGAPLNYRLKANRRPGGVRWMPSRLAQISA